MLTKELLKLNTKRLLAYYRSIRAKEGKLRHKYFCESCRDFHYPTHPDTEYEALKNHVTEVKSILDTRENVRS